MHTYILRYIPINMHNQIRSNKHKYVQTYTRIHLYTRLHTSKHKDKQIRTYIRTQIQKYFLAHIYIYVCEYIFMHFCIFASNILQYSYTLAIQVLKNISYSLHCLLLQQDLDAIAVWGATWPLTLNIAKCFYIRFGLVNKPLFNYYILSGVALSQVLLANDLGFVLNSRLDFFHCHKVAAKVFALVNMLLKCFNSNNRNFLQFKLFLAFARHILEFNSSMRSPHLARDIIAIEKVSKIFF